jgi:hypothetical protein
VIGTHIAATENRDCAIGVLLRHRSSLHSNPHTVNHDRGSERSCHADSPDARSAPVRLLENEMVVLLVVADRF